MATQKEIEAEQKRYQNMVTGSARVVTRSRPRAGASEVLGITTLMDFIKAYVKVNPNLLYFTPQSKISKEEKALLMLLQCFDENNKDITEPKRKLTETLTKIKNERKKK